jgi:WG containing repeat
MRLLATLDRGERLIAGDSYCSWRRARIRRCCRQRIAIVQQRLIAALTACVVLAGRAPARADLIDLEAVQRALFAGRSDGYRLAAEKLEELLNRAYFGEDVLALDIARPTLDDGLHTVISGYLDRDGQPGRGSSDRVLFRFVELSRLGPTLVSYELLDEQGEVFYRGTRDLPSGSFYDSMFRSNTPLAYQTSPARLASLAVSRDAFRRSSGYAAARSDATRRAGKASRERVERAARYGPSRAPTELAAQSPPPDKSAASTAPKAPDHFVRDLWFESFIEPSAYDGRVVHEGVEFFVFAKSLGRCDSPALDPQGNGRKYQFAVHITNLTNRRKRIHPQGLEANTDGVGVNHALLVDHSIFDLKPLESKAIQWMGDCLVGQQTIARHQMNIQTYEEMGPAPDEKVVPFLAANRWGYRNRRTQTVIIAPRFDTALAFSEGRAAVVIAGGKGYCFIDLQGNVVIPGPYFNVALGPGKFVGGRIRVCEDIMSSTCYDIDRNGQRVP